MSADFESGFFVKKPAWHRLGQTIATAPNTREGIRLAGLDWTVQRRDIEVVPTLFTDAIPAEAEAKWPTLDAPQPDLSAWKALVRDTDQQALGVVGKGYNVLQNAEAFEFFDPLLSCGDATLETAGSLRKGKTIWVMARLKQDPLVVRGDDHVMPYLLLSNTHDATQAVRVNYTMVRVVCGKEGHHRGGFTVLRNCRGGHSERGHQCENPDRPTAGYGCPGPDKLPRETRRSTPSGRQDHRRLLRVGRPKGLRTFCVGRLQRHHLLAGTQTRPQWTNSATLKLVRAVQQAPW